MRPENPSSSTHSPGFCSQTFLAQFQNMYIGPWSNTGWTGNGLTNDDETRERCRSTSRERWGRGQGKSVDNLSLPLVPRWLSVSLRSRAAYFAASEPSPRNPTCDVRYLVSPNLNNARVSNP